MTARCARSEALYGGILTPPTESGIRHPSGTLDPSTKAADIPYAVSQLTGPRSLVPRLDLGPRSRHALPVAAEPTLRHVQASPQPG